MAEQIYKLSPHRDLQCYFLTPSAIAAISQANDSGFIVSGKWRQQFDWAVVEWNRDNVFEHPALRYLPDGDLSGLVLSYDEERSNCIPIESNLFPVVDWNNLRIWATPAGGVEQVYAIPVAGRLAVPVSGNSIPASATMTLVESPGANRRVGVALLENHHYYVVGPNDQLPDIAQGIATAINGNSDIIGNPDFSAVSQGASVVITWKQNLSETNDGFQLLGGANGNRVGVYGFAEGGAQVWQSPAVTFSGGAFPTKYRITIDFAQLKAQGVPTDNVRKLRWTWAADLQAAMFQQPDFEFQQTSFEVRISNWTVTGSNRIYSVAGPGSRRIEDTATAVSYAGNWTESAGNYSGSRIRQTGAQVAGAFVGAQGASCSITYSETASHQLFLGTRLLPSGADVSVAIDGQSSAPVKLALNGEDVLVRVPIGSVGAGAHTVTVTQTSPDSTSFWFDFLEIVHPATDLPDFEPQNQLALATDWDTYHSQSLPAERTAWLINKLGFQGRVDHYVGALWFYELVRTGTQYASLSVTLAPEGNPQSENLVLNLAAAPTPANPQPAATSITHLVLLDDTTANVVQALAALINVGTNLVWAKASGSELTITARAMGTAGNGITVQLDTHSQGFTLAGGTELSGGVDGTSFNLDPSDPLQLTLMAATQGWCTDLAATPRINRAAWDWHTAYFTALKSYGIDAVAAFSTELGNGDPSDQVGIAQRYWDNTPVVVNTPAVQTNFSPTAVAFWKQVYLDMVTIQTDAGMVPYLQSGEVQWWYFAKDITVNNKDISAMTFYDAYTQQQFAAQYGQNMQLIQSGDTPDQHPNEVAFLPTLIGAYTAAIRNALQMQSANCRYEVLYPNDVNNTPLNLVVNFPAADWKAENLDCLKTESFGFTGSYRLDQSTYSIGVSAAKGFPNSKRSHLVGVGDASSSWMKEVDVAQSEGLESVVLWALDQYCLVGYPPPPFVRLIRAGRQG